MEEIPTHKTAEKLNGEIAFIKRAIGKTDLSDHAISYAHRDDYYTFLWLEKGYVKILIDFKEYEMFDNTIRCVMPGQVHSLLNSKNVTGWLLGIDSLIVNDSYKEIFESALLFKSKAILNDLQAEDLKSCISIINRRLNSDKESKDKNILHNLLITYIGIIAETYQKGLPSNINNKSTSITFQFKNLLSSNYQILKAPAQYADKLNISPIYLNEIVKKTTGITVSQYIQNEIIIQAKRLLYYTDKSIKEIALELGYEDWAYFTRLFTKISGLNPTQFRKKYLK